MRTLRLSLTGTVVLTLLGGLSVAVADREATLCPGSANHSAAAQYGS